MGGNVESMRRFERLTDGDSEAVQFARCLGCGGALHSEESRRLGAGAACRDRLGEAELDRRRASALASDRVHLWLDAEPEP